MGRSMRRKIGMAMPRPSACSVSAPAGLRGTLRLALCFTALNGMASSALGQDGGEAEARAMLDRGRAIAEAHCSKCHAIGLMDESPTWVNANTPFRRLYERFPIKMLTEAAKTGSISGHDEMPGFDFALEDVEALLAYIDSLAPGRPAYVTPPHKH
jgi:mono/diheme cytochrome c family protein